MQTVQLLGGPAGRGRFLARAREHLMPGAVLALAIADALECFDEAHSEPPMPDVLEVAGTVYASRPVAVRDEGDRVAIERIRETVDRRRPPHGRGRRRAPRPPRRARRSRPRAARPASRSSLAVPCTQTDEYIGSEVVVLGA